MSGMNVPSSMRKERLSAAYIKAVAARAGYDALETRLDLDSIDGLLKSTSGRRPQIDFQAKSTSINILGDEHVVFELPFRTYENLRAETVVPRILIVVVLPEDEELWLSVSEDALVLRKCGYWLSLRGAPPTDNSTSISVRLPRTQVFDVTQLSVLMQKAESGPTL